MLKFKFLIILFMINSGLMFTPVCAQPLSVMTFNIENGGDQVDLAFVIQAIQKSKADVVGIQEAWGNLEKIAQGLQWQYVSRRQHIISRFPLYETDADYLWVEIAPQQFAVMSNVHLPDTDYGPDQQKMGVCAKTIIAKEKTIRLAFIQPMINKLTALAKKGWPVFLTGDFNSPSHLDTQKMVWPVTQALVDSGFVDTYRRMHASGGLTWPASRPLLKASHDGFNPSTVDGKARLDFIFSHGPNQLLNSHLIGEADHPESDISLPVWPSDHRAVVSQFKIIPKTRNVPSNKLALQEILATNACLLVTPHNISVHDSFKIMWKNAPGYRYDYIRIAPAHHGKLAWEDAIRLYTFGKKQGELTFGPKNSKGNWPLWHQVSPGIWPLTPGRYEIALMLDDSFKILAKTEIEVSA